MTPKRGERVRFTASNGQEDHGTVVALSCSLNLPSDNRRLLADFVTVLSTRNVVHLVAPDDVLWVCEP